jgi:hypothetical protein
VNVFVFCILCNICIFVPYGRKYKAFAIIHPGKFLGTFSLRTTCEFTIRRFTFLLPGHLVDGHGAGALGALPVSVQVAHRGGKKAALWKYKNGLKNKFYKIVTIK